MAYEKRRVLDDSSHSNRNRYEHLFKLFFYRDTDEFIHWCKEVANFSSCSPCNSKISEKEFKRVLWKSPQDEYIAVNVAGELQDYALLGFPEIDEYRYVNFFDFLFDFHAWLIKRLSRSSGRVFTTEIRDIVTQLLNEYGIN